MHGMTQEHAAGSFWKSRQNTKDEMKETSVGVGKEVRPEEGG